MAHTKWMRDLSKLAIFDPSEKGLNPHVDVNSTKINHLTKNFLVERGCEGWEKEFGQTLYNLVKDHPTLNNMLLLAEKITVEEYKALIVKGKGASKLYSPAIPSAKDYILAGRDLSAELTEILKKPSEVELGSLGAMKLPNAASLTAINALLGAEKLPSLDDMFVELSHVGETIEKHRKDKNKAEHELAATNREVERLKSEVTNLMAKVATAAVNVEYTTERGELPNGKVVVKKAKDIWNDMTLPPKIAEMEVPTWEWDGPHPDVPEVDPHYIFRPKHLGRLLYALITNQREYIQGHTGSGKTTLVEQVAARLNWPFLRINFDSEITRMDLIGRDTLVSDSDGNVTSVFIDGMLPTAMSGPYICCFDELDFVRPDVAYVMQAALEGNGLRITEDGDRIVRPHPMFRMFGTGNTVGQGDEHGMYQGARPQSMAFLDRFTIWDKIEYLEPKEREALVTRKFPGLGNDEKKQVLQYTTEHLEAFTQGKVIQPISPRGMLAICQATIMLGSVKEALEMSILDRANAEDRATLKGLVDRVAK